MTPVVYRTIVLPNGLLCSLGIGGLLVELFELDYFMRVHYFFGRIVYVLKDW